MHAGCFSSRDELATQWLAEFFRQQADSIFLLFQTQKFLCNSLLIAMLDTRQSVFLTSSVPWLFDLRKLLAALFSSPAFA